MPTVADLLRKLHPERGAVPTDEAVDALAPSESILSQLASLPFDAAGKVLQGISYVDQKTRELAGSVAGVDLTEDASGEALARGVAGKLGIPFPEQREGQLDAADVIGFATELGVSPFMLVSPLRLTKAGEVAAQATRLADRLKALQGISGTSKAAEIAETSAELAKLGKFERYGKTFGEQAEKGQRALLSLDIPFTGINAPLIRGAGVQKALSGIGGPIKGALRPAVNLFRRDLGNPELRAAIDVSDDTKRLAEQLGIGEGRQVAKFVKENEAAAATALPDLKLRLERLADVAISELDNLGGKRAERAIKTVDLTRGITGRSAAGEMLGLGLEVNGVPQKLASEISTITEEASKATTEMRRQIAELEAKLAAVGPESNYALFGDPTKRIGILKGRVTKLNKAAAKRVAILEVEQGVREEAFRLLPAPIRAEANRLKAVADNLLDVEREAGVATPELSDNRLGYLYRLTNPEGKRWAQSLHDDSPFSKLVRENQPNADFTKRRTTAFDGMTHFQINQWARDLGFKGDFLIEDPAEIMLRRISNSGQARGSAHFAQGAVEMFHQPASMAGKGAMRIEEFMEKAGTTKYGTLDIGKSPTEAQIKKMLAGTSLEGTFIPRDIADDFLRAHKVIETPEMLRKLVDFHDDAAGAIRFAVTQPFAQFHVRNFAGNLFAMFMGGMRNPKYLYDGMRLAYRIMRGTATPAEQATWRRMGELGAIGTSIAKESASLSEGKTAFGRVLQKLPLVGSKAPESVRGSKALGKVVGATQIGRKLGGFGDWIENGSKAAMYLWAKDKGKGDYEAAKIVQKYLFDYLDLSRFEKGVARRAAMFYTYQRKVWPMLLEQMHRNPTLFRAYAQLSGERAGSPQDKYVPEYLRKYGQFYFGTDSEGRETFRALDLPPSNLFDYETEGRGFSRGVQKLAANASPAIQALVQAASFPTNIRTGQLASGGAGELLTRLLPTSRFVSQGQQFLGALSGSEEGGRLPMDVLVNLAGGPTVTRIEPGEGAKRKLDQKIQSALERFASQGEARRKREFRPVIGSDDEAAVRELMSLRARLLAR